MTRRPRALIIIGMIRCPSSKNSTISSIRLLLAWGFCTGFAIASGTILAAQENSAGVGNPLEVTSSVFRRDDGSGAPGEAVAQFYPSDRHQHFEVSVRGIAENSIVHWDFSALDTSVGPRDKIASVERRIPPLGGASEVPLHRRGSPNSCSLATTGKAQRMLK